MRKSRYNSTQKSVNESYFPKWVTSRLQKLTQQLKKTVSDNDDMIPQPLFKRPAVKSNMSRASVMHDIASNWIGRSSEYDNEENEDIFGASIRCSRATAYQQSQIPGSPAQGEGREIIRDSLRVVNFEHKPANAVIQSWDDLRERARSNKEISSQRELRISFATQLPNASGGTHSDSEVPLHRRSSNRRKSACAKKSSRRSTNFMANLYSLVEEEPPQCKQPSLPSSLSGAGTSPRAPGSNSSSRSPSSPRARRTNVSFNSGNSIPGTPRSRRSGRNRRSSSGNRRRSSGGNRRRSSGGTSQRRSLGRKTPQKANDEENRKGYVRLSELYGPKKGGAHRSSVLLFADKDAAHSPDAWGVKSASDRYEVFMQSSSLGKLYRAEKEIQDADLSDDAKEFFGENFNRNEARFPDWLLKHKNFRRHCPRLFPTMGDLFLEKKHIPYELAMRKALCEQAFLKDSTPAQLKKLIKMWTIEVYPKGSYLCKQGDRADYMFFVVEGELEILVLDNKKNKEFLVNSVCDGALLGELGYENKSIRTASVKAATEVRVALLAHTSYRKLLLQKRRNHVLNLEKWMLRKVSTFQIPYMSRKIESVARILIPKILAPKEMIYEESSPASSLYIVKSGEILGVHNYRNTTTHTWPASSKKWDYDTLDIVSPTLEIVLDTYTEGRIFGLEGVEMHLWAVRQWSTRAANEAAETLHCDIVPLLKLIPKAEHLLKEKWLADLKVMDEKKKRMEDELEQKKIYKEALDLSCAKKYSHRKHGICDPRVQWGGVHDE